MFKTTRTSLPGGNVPAVRSGMRPLYCLLLMATFYGVDCKAQASRNAASPGSKPGETPLPDAPGMGEAAPALALGSVAGLVVDVNGSVIAGAQVTLLRAGSSTKLEVVSDSEGRFFFAGVPAGSLQITIAAPSFAARSSTALLHNGENLQLPDTVLTVGATTTEVQVTMTQEELAEKQIKVQEKQHVLGIIPNFYASYDHNAVPLTSKQKFELAWKSNIDPFAFIGTGIAAGIEQATNGFSGYGQGAQGYAKRYGAGYADGFIGTMIGGAILPSLFKQDPRYFWKGDGTIRSRVFYAVGRAVLTKGDNGHTQVDYSGILGDLAAAGISNIYYPASDRNGASLTFENLGIGLGCSAVGNLFQEFLVRKLTPHTRDTKPLEP